MLWYAMIVQLLVQLHIFLPGLHYSAGYEEDPIVSIEFNTAEQLLLDPRFSSVSTKITHITLTLRSHVAPCRYCAIKPTLSKISSEWLLWTFLVG